MRIVTDFRNLNKALKRPVWPVPTTRPLSMSKRALVHATQLETQDPLAARHLPEDSELRSITGMLGELGTVVMPDGTRFILRNGTDILIPTGKRQRI